MLGWNWKNHEHTEADSKKNSAYKKRQIFRVYRIDLEGQELFKQIFWSLMVHKLCKVVVDQKKNDIDIFIDSFRVSTLSKEN